jgi:hypothetical protein
VEAVPSRLAIVVLLPVLLPHRSASRLCADDHRETMRSTQDRGLMLVGGKLTRGSMDIQYLLFYVGIRTYPNM